MVQWFIPRQMAKGVYERIAQHRADYLEGGVWSSLSADAPFHLRSHRVFVSLGVPEGAKVSDEELITLRESMASMLRPIDVEAQILDPVGLLKLVDDLTSPTTVSGEDVVDYNRFDPIADQAVRREMEIVTDPNRLLCLNERFRARAAPQDGMADPSNYVPTPFQFHC